MKEDATSNFYEFDFSFQSNKRKIVKYFGAVHPLSTVETKEDGSKVADFFGVVALEVKFNDIVGMEYTNMLIYSARVVFEAKTILKKSFKNITDCFNYYKISQPNSLVKSKE